MLLANHMSHPVKKIFCGSLVALCLLGSAWGQSTVSFTNSATALGNNSFVNFDLNQFDSGLGTLTGVVVTLNFVTVGGSFSVTADSATVNFNSASARVTVQGSNTNLGFSTTGITNQVTTTPGASTEISEGATQAFTVQSTNFLTNQTQSISSNFWSAYQTAGSGTVSFQVRNNPSLNVSGDNNDWSSVRTNFTATANMSVTYTYTSAEPIPEPSTVAAGAFLTVLAAASYWRRRRSAR
jgi:hypothetical protein